MATKPETTLVNKILKRLQAEPHSYWTKIHGSPFQRKGLPDIVGVRGGRFVAIEVKVGKNKPTDLQQLTLTQLDTAGALTLVAYSVEDVDNLFRQPLDNDV